MGNIERKWIGVGTGALGALAFDDEATALQYVQDCGGSWPVVEYVPASQLAGAVELAYERGYWDGVQAMRDVDGPILPEHWKQHAHDAAAGGQ